MRLTDSALSYDPGKYDAISFLKFSVAVRSEQLRHVTWFSLSLYTYILVYIIKL